MEILKGKRGSGKTKELIKISHEKWVYIICLTSKRAHFIADMARKMKIDIPCPICAMELPLNKNAYIKEVLVDDLEDILTYFIDKPVLVATTSCEVKIKRGETND